MAESEISGSVKSLHHITVGVDGAQQDIDFITQVIGQRFLKATVLFDGNKTSLLGRVRLFDPPELQPGVVYTYKITASWMQGGQLVTDVRSVSVMGGQVTLVDFTRPAGVEPVGPPAPAKKQE